MSDMLHQLKKSIWKSLIDWFEILLKYYYEVQEANQYLDEIDKHISLVPQFPGIKSFPKGLRNVEQVTANEYADIIKVPSG